jgi:hypothetical protein
MQAIGSTQMTDTRLDIPQAATIRSFKPLNTSEAPDFLDITSSDSNEDLPGEKGYVQYNATRSLPLDV